LLMAVPDAGCAGSPAGKVETERTGRTLSRDFGIGVKLGGWGILLRP